VNLPTNLPEELEQTQLYLLGLVETLSSYVPDVWSEWGDQARLVHKQIVDFRVLSDQLIEFLQSLGTNTGGTTGGWEEWKRWDRLELLYVQLSTTLQLLAGREFEDLHYLVIEQHNKIKALLHSRLCMYILEGIENVPTFKAEVGKFLDSIHQTFPSPELVGLDAVSNHVTLAQHRIDNIHKELEDKGIADPEVITTQEEGADTDIVVVIKPEKPWLWDKVRGLIDKFFDSQRAWWGSVILRIIVYITTDSEAIAQIKKYGLLPEYDTDINWTFVESNWPSLRLLE
jgi:hypothetical protein